MKKLWKNYNLSIVLLILFLIAWTGQFIVQIFDVMQEAKDHHQEFKFNEFFVKFLSSTLENWQSEFLQLLTFVVLTSFLIHKNSHESKDSDERIEKKIDQILKELKKD